MAELLSLEDLPEGFDYPSEFIRVVELGMVNLEPWWILEGDLLRSRQQGLKERYPRRRLVVFARRQDNDDVACWDLAANDVAIVHDFASPGYEHVRSLPDFNDWLRQAIEDLIEFS